MLRSGIRTIKNALLPDTIIYRRIPVGIAAGIVLKMDFHDNAMLYFGLYETELNPFYHALLKPGMRCFDVGGSIGYTAFLLAKLTRNRVVTFENEAENVESIRQACTYNPWAQVEIIQAYVSDQHGEGHLRLDDAVSQTFMPDFIKIDIEGAEAEALRGADHILRTRRPHLIVEVHSQEIEEMCIALLNEYQYMPEIVNQRRWLRETGRHLAHNRWLVCRGDDRKS